jgi:hypothetical protein
VSDVSESEDDDIEEQFTRFGEGDVIVEDSSDDDMSDVETSMDKKKKKARKDRAIIEIEYEKEKEMTEVQHEQASW